MTSDPIELGREVVHACLSMGFVRAGVAPAAQSGHRDEVVGWLSDGRHGEMRWLEEELDKRLDPGALVEGAKSVVVVADQYASRTDPPAGVAVDGGAAVGKVARYARGRDYHRVIKRRLHALADSLRASSPGHAFRSFVDTAPVLEREHAARAGLGWVGKNTMLIDPHVGSYLLLGGIVTTLELAPEPDAGAVADYCGHCTRCIDACPTGAITPWRVDATRCISYLTIEHRSVIDLALHERMGGWVFGCDVCQEVCPFNSPRPPRPGGARGAPGDRVNRAYSARRGSLGLLEVLGWDEEDRRRAFSTSAMKRATLDMMKRNALIAAGNALRRRADAALLGRIREIAADASEPELVRITARQVIASLPAA